MCEYPELNTYFYNEEGKNLNATLPGLHPIPLYEGMRFIIKGHPHEYTVVEWSFHLVHADMDPGLHIILR